jgi:drug/metabolite transporter (DMT)-like permease
MGAVCGCARCNSRLASCVAKRFVQALETQMKPAHLIILLVLNVFWAGVYSAYKIIGQTLPYGGIVTLRFGLAAVFFLLAWPWLPGRAPRGRDLVVTCILGLVVFVLGQRLQVGGNQLGTAGNSAVLMALEPLVTSVAAALFLHERIGPRRLAGFGLALLGVALLNQVWRADFQWMGLAASVIFVSSFVCEASYSVLGKPIIGRAGVMKMLAISLLVGTAANLLIDGRETMAVAARLSLQAWGLLLWLALICTVVGYTLWFVIIRECPVNVAALTIFAQSIFGVALAAVWLHEGLHWGQLAGSLTIAAGLAVGFSRQIEKPG